VFFGVVHDLRQTQGPRWLATYADPEYPHLMSAALVGSLQAPSHVDNPGTPLHVLGGAIIRLQHTALGHGAFLDDVVERPEFYLAGLHLIILIGITGALFGAGVIVRRSTGSMLAAGLAQFSPCCFWQVVSTSTTVMPEMLVNGLAALFAAVLVRQSAAPARRQPLVMTVAILGAIAGIACAVKVTALPLLLVPLISLRSRHERLWFISAAIGSFLVGILPILPRIDRFLSFVTRCTSHSGQYGAGAAGLDLSSFLNALRSIVQGNKLAAGILLLELLVLLPMCLAAAFRNNPWSRLFLAITLAQCAQVLLAAKGSEPRYAVASMGLIGVNLWLLWQNAAALLPEQTNCRHFTSFLLACIVLVALGLHVRNVAASHASSARNRDARQQIAAEAELRQQRGETLVFGHWASSPVNALYVGNGFTEGRFSRLLARRHKGLFFISWVGSLADWESEGIDWSRFLAEHPRAILQGDTFSTDAVESVGTVRLAKLSSVSAEVCPILVEGIYSLEARGKMRAD